MEKPERYHQYYKRSLREVDHSGNVLPLNFNVPLAYKSSSLLWNMNGDILFDKWSRIEVLKALDIFGLVSKSSHSSANSRPIIPTARPARIRRRSHPGYSAPASVDAGASVADPDPSRRPRGFPCVIRRAFRGSMR